MPCDLQKSCLCKSSEREQCTHWNPAPGSRYSKCSRYLASRISCDLPHDACKECPFFISEKPRRSSKIDWTDKDAVREYRADRKRQNKLKIRQEIENKRELEAAQHQAEVDQVKAELDERRKQKNAEVLAREKMADEAKKILERERERERKKGGLE